MHKYFINFKLIIIGDSSVGKTNLVLRFTENTFTVNIPPTIGYDYKSKTIILSLEIFFAKLVHFYKNCIIFAP